MTAKTRTHQPPDWEAIAAAEEAHAAEVEAERDAARADAAALAAAAKAYMDEAMREDFDHDRYEAAQEKLVAALAAHDALTGDKT